MTLLLRAGALGTLVWLTFGTADLWAQAAPAGAPHPAAAGSAADTTDTVVKKKKGGLIGAAKKVAGNKVVKQVAKVAACTMVPGGQAVAGAIDAASAKSAGEAAQGAAGAATGSSCMPGMGGAGMANTAAQAAANSAAPTGPPQGMMPYGAAGAPGYPGGQAMMAGTEASDAAMAQCLGIPVEDYQAMARPAGYEPRAPTNDEMKRAGKISKKVGAQRQAQCSQQVGMQQASSQMAAMQQMMAGAQGGMPSPGDPAASGRTEAPGKEPTLAADPAAELKKGKTALRDIDWAVGSTEVSPAAAAAFERATARLGQAMREAGGRFRVDLYMDQRYDEAAAGMYGPGRLARLQQMLAAGAGDPASVIETGKVKRDKDPRVEIVRVH